MIAANDNFWPCAQESALNINGARLRMFLEELRACLDKFGRDIYGRFR